MHNTPSILVDKIEVNIIDIAIAGNSRINEKERGKIKKYQDLKIAIQRLWCRQAVVILAVIGASVPKMLELH